MTDNNIDPAAKTRILAGVILLPFVWIIVAATVVALLMVLPTDIVETWAWLVVLVGLLVAGSGTATVVNTVINKGRIETE